MLMRVNVRTHFATIAFTKPKVIFNCRKSEKSEKSIPLKLVSLNESERKEL